MVAVLLCGAIGLVYSLFLTPLFTKGFRRLRWGQFIREDGPKSHYAKRGTPTMGGIVFISGAVISYFLTKLITGTSITASGLLILFAAVGCAAIGFIDDFMKTHRQQSLGLGGWAKMSGLLIVASVFALLSLQFPNKYGNTPANTHISLFRDFEWSFLSLGIFVGFLLFLLWIILIMSATANAVNLTDGLDGLAAGSATMVFFAYLIIGIWQANQSCVLSYTNIGCYNVRDPLDIAVVAAAIVGGLIGFLWWNTSPAQLYMGDTGSMGIGGAIAALAIISHTELLLIILGGLFIIEAGSVILQRLYFKITRGRRIFLMSPIHHHFELKGWKEVTVVVRFWIISGIFVIIGIGLFYGEWIILNGY